MGSIIFVDIPTYQVELESDYRSKLLVHLKAEELIARNKLPQVNWQQGEMDFTLGLLTMARYLKKRGHDVAYFLFEENIDQLLSITKCFDFVGLTAMTPVIHKANKVAKAIKMNMPNKIIILGGYHGSFISPEAFNELPFIDIVVRGEGEIIIDQIINGEKPIELISGITYRDTQGKTKVNEGCQFLSDGEIPSPEYSILPGDFNQYRINLSTARGCVYNCAFCANHPFWGNDRCRSISSVIRELDELKKRLNPGTLIHFSDNILTRDRERAVKLCELIAEREYPFYFSCDIRSRHLDARIIKAMNRAKFIKISIGFEDACDRVLNICRKGLKYQDNIKSAKMIKDNSDILVNAYWLVALPGSSKGTLGYNFEQVSKLLEFGIVDTVNNKMLVIYPGTKFYENPDVFGIEILHKNWEFYDCRVTPMYKLRELDENEIYNGFMKMEDVILNEYCNILRLPIDALQCKPLTNLSRHTAARYLADPLVNNMLGSEEVH